MAPTLLGQLSSLTQVQTKPLGEKPIATTTLRPSRPGDHVVVSGRVFEVSRMLGRGAFGTVWEARLDGADAQEPTIALKCCQPQSKKEIDSLAFEFEVMQHLTESLQENNRAPRYIAHSFSADSADVHLAMSKVEGCRVDLWLYGNSDLIEISMEKLLYGPHPCGQHGSRDLAGAAAAANAFLTQMVPVFASLEKVAYHRDVSATNFMIDASSVGQLDFTMIDFGLAVRSGTWKEACRTSNIAGDALYWSPATWMAFTHGYMHLEAHPDAVFRHQYETGIDKYAFGLLVLEVFFALWDQESGRSDLVAAAHAAWRVYWTRTVGMFQAFHRGGPMQLREKLRTSDGLSGLVSDNRSLCAALSEAGHATKELRVLAAAAELISLHSLLSWEEIAHLSKFHDTVSPHPLLPAESESSAPCGEGIPVMTQENTTARVIACPPALVVNPVEPGKPQSISVATYAKATLQSNQVAASSPQLVCQSPPVPTSLRQMSALTHGRETFARPMFGHQVSMPALERSTTSMTMQFGKSKSGPAPTLLGQMHTLTQEKVEVVGFKAKAAPVPTMLGQMPHLTREQGGVVT